jgi:hypothetical protein
LIFVVFGWHATCRVERTGDRLNRFISSNLVEATSFFAQKKLLYALFWRFCPLQRNLDSRHFEALKAVDFSSAMRLSEHQNRFVDSDFMKQTPFFIFQLFWSCVVKFDGLACNSRLTGLKLPSLSSLQKLRTVLLSYHIGTFGWLHSKTFLGNNTS